MEKMEIVRVTFFPVDTHAIVECSVCGPLGVTASVDATIEHHLLVEHQNEKASW